MHFQQANMQRNYLIHNLYASFENEIERKLLPVENLAEMDVYVYTQQVDVTGVSQGSCRFYFYAACNFTSGFNSTRLIKSQLRMSFDQRSGCCICAA